MAIDPIRVMSGSKELTANEITDRKKMVLAMEYLVRHINNDSFIMHWLALGVPDGDIPYGSFDITDVDDDYVEDETLREFTKCFLECMSSALEDGGLVL